MSIKSTVQSIVQDDTRYLSCLCGTDQKVEESVQTRAAHRGVGLTANLWKRGQTLNFRFWGGLPVYHRYVIEASDAIGHGLNVVWSVSEDVGLAHEENEEKYKDSADALFPPEIRCTFRDGGSWSFLGNDVLKLPWHRNTMNFGWLDWAHENERYDEIHRVVTHELLHMLGMLHEQDHPDCPVIINQAGYDHFAQYGIDKDGVYRMFMRRPERKDATTTPYDDESIMGYYLDKKFDASGNGIPFNGKMSQGDRMWVQLNYGNGTVKLPTEPEPEPKEPEPKEPKPKPEPEPKETEEKKTYIPIAYR